MIKISQTYEWKRHVFTIQFPICSFGKKKTLLIIQYHSESESSLSFMFIEQTGVA